MTALRQALGDYLAVRHALGYKLAREEQILPQFLDFLEGRGEQHVNTDAAVAWATLPARSATWSSSRLRIVRGFATYLHAIDPIHEIPAPDLLPWRSTRATPYLYSEQQIAALITAAGTLRTPHRVATIQTLLGLLAVTGMRIGEVVGLDRTDFDTRNGCLVVRGAKFGKSRELALHPSTTTAVRQHLQRTDRPTPSPGTAALLITSVGTRLRICDVQRTFRTLTGRAGIVARSESCRPRVHDMRHSFAVATVLDGYHADADVGHRLALLATYLGHVNPAATYWYLSAAPELMQLAADRLERHAGGRP
ncbi:MAG: tyrosine-type recombinase/integrase [Solirubrobacteraceae bacterium]